jgi:hypothetical protein
MDGLKLDFGCWLCPLDQRPRLNLLGSGFVFHQTWSGKYLSLFRPQPPLSNLIRVQKSVKTYNSGDSLVVTHLTTNPPVHCLYMAERTGSLIFSVLWSYVKEQVVGEVNIPRKQSTTKRANMNTKYQWYHHEIVFQAGAVGRGALVFSGC